jgi:lipopolysaccharide assembly protein A
MRFIGLLFYICLGGALAWLAAQNWVPVQLHLTRETYLEWPLALLLLAAFLLGLVPLMIIGGLSKWALRRKLTKAEKQIAALQAAASPAARAAQDEEAMLARVRAAGGAGSIGDLPQTKPIAVPPGA